MAKQKIDGVIEAVHYEPEGRIKWVRAFLRRGATYSDWLILDRQSLIEQLKAGKKFYAGKRIEYLASTFDLGDPVSLMTDNGGEVITLGKTVSNKDQLSPLPRI